MQGKRHLMAGLPMFPSLLGLAEFAENTFPDMLLLPQYFGIFHTLQIGAGVLGFTLGLLLPDCDTKNSILGRHFHLPFEHRTWTHAIWFPLILVLAAYWTKTVFFLWIAAGWMVHLFQDSFSAMGDCFLYPITGYREYPSGARVKKGRHLSLYHNNATSEKVFAAGWCVVSVILSIGVMYYFDWLNMRDMLQTIGQTIQ